LRGSASFRAYVKINFAPAMTNTAANRIRITRTGKCRLPK
jgi:hypothetical protein